MIVGKSRQSDNGYVRWQFTNDSRCIQSTEIGHFHIHQDDIRIYFYKHVDGFYAIFGTFQVVFLTKNSFGQDVIAVRVFGYQNSFQWDGFLRRHLYFFCAFAACTLFSGRRFIFFGAVFSFFLIFVFGGLGGQGKDEGGSFLKFGGHGDCSTQTFNDCFANG